MKRIVSLVIISFYVVSSGAQISLSGVVTVQNSKVNTGLTVHVPNVQVASPYAQPNTTDNEGKFMLRFTGVEAGRQVQLSVSPFGAFKEYVVVNHWDLNQTLGRKSSLSIYVAKQEDLDLRKAEMVGINMEKYEARADKTIKRLQDELEIYKKNSDYMNFRFKEILDSLQIVNQDITTAYKLIEEYAKSLVTQNLDDKEENYINAYNCFAKGELDSVKYYLKEDELDRKYQELLQLKQEGEKEKEFIQILTESASIKEEHYENGINDLIKEWLLLAQTAALQNKYEEAKLFYEKAIHVDVLNIDLVFIYAEYLYSIREYSKSEEYYQQCLERYRIMEKENPTLYLENIALTLNNLANVHSDVNEYRKALEEYEEALEIRRKLEEEKPNIYLVNVAATLNNLAILHAQFNENQKALEEYDEALRIYKKLNMENPKAYLANVALTLNNLSVFYNSINEYFKANEGFEEVLAIYRKLAEDNPETYLADVAKSLNNMAILHRAVSEYSKALEEYEEALEIRRKLAAENPRTYLVDVATTLNNLAVLHRTINQYPKALEDCEEALAIYRKLVEENPKAYFADIIRTLNNLAILHRTANNFSKSIDYLNIINDLIIKYKEQIDYTHILVRNYGTLSWFYLFTGEYILSEQSAGLMLELDSTQTWIRSIIAHALLFQNRFTEAVEIYKALLEENEVDLLDDLESLENAGVIPEERKPDIEKVREMLKQE